MHQWTDSHTRLATICKTIVAYKVLAYTFAAATIWMCSTCQRVGVKQCTNWCIEDSHDNSTEVLERTSRRAERALEGLGRPRSGMGPLGGVVGADWLPDCSQRRRAGQASRTASPCHSAWL